MEGGTVAGVAAADTTVELLLPVTVIAVDAELDWSLDTKCWATTGAVTVVELAAGFALIYLLTVHDTDDADFQLHIDGILSSILGT
jgi:hypothetical protein